MECPVDYNSRSVALLPTNGVQVWLQYLFKKRLVFLVGHSKSGIDAIIVRERMVLGNRVCGGWHSYYWFLLHYKYSWMLFCQVWLRFIVCLLNVVERGNLTQLQWCPTIPEDFLVKLAFHFIPSTLRDHLFILHFSSLAMPCQYYASTSTSFACLWTMHTQYHVLAILVL